MKLTLMPHQEKAIKWLKNGNLRFLFGDVGIGKTIIAFSFLLEIIEENPNINVVIAVHKNDMITQFKKEWLEKMQIKLPNNITLLSHSMLNNDNFTTDILIIDEFHLLKGGKKKYENMLIKNSFKQLIIMTATPNDDIGDLRVYVEIMENMLRDYDDIKIYGWKKITKKFMDKNFGCEYDYFGNLKKILDTDYLLSIFLPLSLIILAHDVMPGIEKFSFENYKKINFDVNLSDIEEAKKTFAPIYANHLNKKLEWLEKIDVKHPQIMEKQNYVAYMENNKVKIAKKQQKFINNNLIAENWKNLSDYSFQNIVMWKLYSKIKLPLIKNICDKNKKTILIYTWKQEKLDLLSYFGNVATNNINEFHKDNKKILVASPRSIAEGVDGLQKICSNLIIVSPISSALKIKQLNGRLNRYQMLQRPNYYVFSNIYEDKMWDKINNKFSLVEELIKYKNRLEKNNI